MTEKTIQRELRRLFANYDYKLCNSFIFNWESDFFAISSSSYSVEVEIKISKADFKKDFTHKVEKHHLFSNHKKQAIVQSTYPFKPYLRHPAVYDPDTYQFKIGDSSAIHLCFPANHLPNKFYYACPEGLINVKDIPAYAGLIYVVQGHAYEVKKAPFLHKIVKSHTASLLSKYYHKHLNDRNEIVQLLWVLDKDNLTDFQKRALRTIRNKFL